MIKQMLPGSTISIYIEGIIFANLCRYKRMICNSLLYASDDVIMKMKEFMENPTEANFMKTAISMRNDLWKKGTKINPEILSLE